MDERTDFLEDVRKASSVLTALERQVIELRFGINDGRSRTLDQVGRELNLTRGQVRRAEADALNKLRDLRQIDSG